MHYNIVGAGDEATLMSNGLIILQFVLVLDDGVADVKREDLHVF